MKAIQFEQYGAPDVLHLAEVNTPVAGPGQIRVRVAAVGVNPADFKWREGMFRERVPLQLPHVVGYDIAGTVDTIGPQVTAYRVGERIVASVRSGYAEFAIADEKNCAAIPDGLDFATAASLPCAALTGVQMIEDAVKPRKGQTLLITGATGAVGRFALHAALALGTRVIAAVRPTYFDEARKLGAQQVVGLQDGNNAALSFDHVADTVGGPQVATLCRHLVPGGSIITVSTTPIDPAGLSATPTFFAYRTDGMRLAQILNQVVTGEVAMPIARRLPLARAAEAHRLIESGGLSGKIILEL
jgi:NADPH:quinone reductase-like Zn-dependent oxidoreductase